MSETGKRQGALALFIARAPLLSALIVLVVLASAGAVFVHTFSDPVLVAREVHDYETILELVGAGLTVIAAIFAAFRIHVRGRTLPWRAVPLILFAVWQMASAYSCVGLPLDKPAEQLLYGHSPACFLFILATSIPIAAVMFGVLSLHRTELGWSASAMTGLTVASGAVFLLQFFHNFDMNFGDWSIHLLAMGVVVGSSAYVGQLLPADQRA